MRLSGPVVVDASVVVEYVVELEFADRATEIVRRVLEAPMGELWAPDLLYPECASALRKLVKHKSLPARAGLTALGHVLSLPISIVPTKALIRACWDLRNSMTPYDGCYVALASRLDVPFVTGDGRLAKAAMKAGLQVHTLA